MSYIDAMKMTSKGSQHCAGCEELAKYMLIHAWGALCMPLPTDCTKTDRCVTLDTQSCEKCGNKLSMKLSTPTD